MTKERAPLGMTSDRGVIEIMNDMEKAVSEMETEKETLVKEEAGESEKAPKKEPTVREQLDALKKPMDRMYYIFLAILLGYNILGSTTIMNYLYYWFYGALEGMDGDLAGMIVDGVFKLRYLIVIPAIYTIVAEVKEKKTQLLMTGMLVLGWIFAMYWRSTDDMVLFEVMVAAVASYKKDFKKAGYIYVGLAAGIMILAFILCMAGLLPDFIKMRGDMERHSFGTIYCTDLAAHWCFLILAYIFIKDGMLKIYDYIAIAALSVVNILYLDARNSLIIVVTASAGALVYTYIVKKGIKLPEKPVKAVQWLMVFSFILLAGLYILMNYTYSPEMSAALRAIPGFHSIADRLNTSSNVTRVLPPSLMGRYFIQVGDGMNSAEKLGFYTFLDDSYISVYVMYGIIGLLMMLALSTGTMYKLKREGHGFRLFLIALVALDCFVEHHWTETGYNIFLILPFIMLPEKAVCKERETEKETGQ